MVELQQLKQLVTIYECGSISAAARQLHISQPALSRSVQRLEEALSIRLFDHGQNKARINAVGIQAVERARSILQEVEDLPQLLREYARGLMTISIGSCAPAPMWNLAAELMELQPDNAVNTEMKTVGELVEGLLADTYHLIITDQPVDREGVLCRIFAEEQLTLSLPLDHPLSGRESLELRDLAGQTMLLYHDLGIWARIIRKLEDLRVHFIVQKERDVLADLISSSNLPCIDSNMLHHMIPFSSHRTSIPIRDPEAIATFYICASPQHRQLLDRLTFAHRSEEQIP